MNISEEAKSHIIGMENLDKILCEDYYNLHDSVLLSCNFDLVNEKADLCILITDHPQFVPHPNLSIPEGQEAVIHFYFDGVQKAEYIIDGNENNVHGFSVQMTDYYPGRYLHCDIDNLCVNVIAETMTVSPIVFRPKTV